MNLATVIALVSALAGSAGIATGIAALRKVGTDNIVNVRSIANTEADSTMTALGQFNEVLRADNIAVHAALTEERADHDKTRTALQAALNGAR